MHMRVVVALYNEENEHTLYKYNEGLLHPGKGNTGMCK